MKKFLAVLAVAMTGFAALAVPPTDIPGVTTEVSGYVDAATAIGIAVLLFVLGRKVIRKLI